ncbi:MAG: hypothetical protein HOV81_17025 [Kofleriaceae bacterium]|nr:hypothetical protein [Kofleriaceae bacterium]
MRLRWLGLALALGLLGSSAPADAQVFKPKAKKTEVKATKASAKKKTPKKKAAARKKSKAASRARPDDLTPDPVAEDSDKDYVKIWDDDE